MKIMKQPPKFWHEADPAKAGALAALLKPAAALYGFCDRIKRKMTTPQKAKAPVICVGNLTVGGAGKTPLVIALCRGLARRGRFPHILTRGYGGSEKGPLLVDADLHDIESVGDEALLLSKVAPTWVSEDRPAGARAAVKASARVIIMDDGFQNPSLKKDCALIVVDGGYGFGNGATIPAGPLREKIEDGLKRADGVILIGRDTCGAEGLINDANKKNIPVFKAAFVPDMKLEDLKTQPLFAFAGIGRPEKFFDSLDATGADVAAIKAFPDHHPYSDHDMEAILGRSQRLNAKPITTTKDAVRLPPWFRDEVMVFPVRLEIENAEGLMDMILAKIRREPVVNQEAESEEEAAGA